MAVGKPPIGGTTSEPPTSQERTVSVPAGDVTLPADLAIPADAATRVRGVVVFAHGSGSSRHSPRNRQVAARLREDRFATVLADLLTPEEERQDARTAALRFDIDRLAERVTALIDWTVAADLTRGLPVGLFGASTGAAAALVAAATRPSAVAAVVSRGGRPDLAGDRLPEVRAPVLLIVGGRDGQVLELNRAAATALTGAPHRLHVVPGATHLFEEPGALPEVADQAALWFAAHLPGPPDPVAGRTSG